MQSWMIACIVVAGVVLALALAFLIGSFVAVKKILGGNRRTPTGETPEKYGVDIAWFDEFAGRAETVEIKSYDGLTLRALMLRQQGEGAHKVAICQHGYGATPRSMQPQAKIFYERGFDVLLPAARAHAMSEGKYIGMAWLDRFDILRWVDKAIELFGKSVSIALAGTSMGGSTVIAAAGMTLPPQVKCVIDDCGFSSQYEEYAAHVKRVKLPASVTLLPLVVGVKLFLGYSVSEADIKPLAAKMRVPALFIHGDKDAYVPYELGVRLYEACGSPDKQFYSVEGAAHAMAYAVDKERYVEVFGGFVDKYIK